MKTVLGRKQTSNNDKWIDVAEHIEEYVSRSELQSAVKDAKEAIKKRTDGLSVAYAWSGGKDSIVLSHICESIGIKKSLFVHSELEYPAYLDWCMKHLPTGCEVMNVGYDIDWLEKHPKMLFPKSDGLNRWYQIVQRNAFSKYFKENSLDILIVGHRKADGNIVGVNNEIRKGTGELRYSPLANWNHELVLAYIHYNKLDIPPIYKWRDGYKCGTHPWPSRMHMESSEQGFREVMEIDPTIVRDAAGKLTAARHFLEGVTE